MATEDQVQETMELDGAEGDVIDGEIVDGQDAEGVEADGDPADRADDGAEGDDQAAAEAGSDAGGDLVITLGEDGQEPEADKSAPSWVRELRKTNREQAKKIRELEAERAASVPKDDAIEVGKKPALSDFDYDDAQYEAAYEAWQERRRKADERAEAKRRQQDEADRAWQEKRAGYDRQKQELRVSDYEEAEEAVAAMFSTEQQGLIVSVADNAAHLVYALGRNPTAAKKLAGIKEPTKFIRELARLEDTKLTVKNRGTPKPPAPEKVVNGSAPKSGAVDNQLEQLRKEAERTGDYSKVLRYKRTARK